jgi:hypothetical protein
MPPEAIEKWGGNSPRHAAGNSGELDSKIEDLGLGSHVDQVGATVQNHVGKEVLLVNLTSLGAGDSDTDGHLVLHQIRQVVIGAIAGWGLCVEVAALIGPEHPLVNKKDVDAVPLLVGNLGELETTRRRLNVITTQNKKKLTHSFLLSR